MNKLKLGIVLVILGNLLYIINTFYSKNHTSDFGDFLSGLLIGLSIGSNVLGIILIAVYIAKDKEEKNK